MAGFDFNISETGELIIDEVNHMINKVSDDKLRIQLAYTRIKSIANNWFYDYVGADLEELVGRAIQKETVEVGKTKILNVLTYDDLWETKDILVTATIKGSTNLVYSVYLRTYTDDPTKEKSTEITINLDLIKGVKINFGW